MDILREKAEKYLEEKKHKLHVTLHYDDVAIRKHLCYSNETNKFVGFTTYISTSKNKTNDDSSQPELAKEALVYMAVGQDFKIPVAYELCNGLDGVDRAALTLQVVKAIESAGAIVMSLTGDGLAGNISAAVILGANFKEGKPYFQSPTYPEQKIYIILDPSHDLKLARKHLSSNKIHYKGKLVDWNLLVTLVNKQSLDNFNLRNKLTKLHINWYQKPMNVRLAAETISKSVADTLEQLRKDGYEEFQNAETTEDFLRFFNNGFDILNFGTNQKSDSKYKQPIREDTANHIFEFAEKFKEYIIGLEFGIPPNSKPILKSSAERGFFGFYYDFVSLQGIYNDFVLNGPLDEFFPFQFSQDHLETFFSLIRYESTCLPW